MNVAVWIESPFCERLGWMLVHSLWQIALIAAGTAVLLAVFRTKARTRYAIAYAGLLLVAAGWSLSNPAIQPEEVAADEPVETEPVDSLDKEAQVADEDAAGALEGRGSTQLTTRVSQPASYGTDRGPRGLCQ